MARRGSSGRSDKSASSRPADRKAAAGAKSSHVVSVGRSSDSASGAKGAHSASRAKRGDSAFGVRSTAAGPESPHTDRWRPWLLGAATALVVARTIYPSETPADTGDGLPIVMLWLALAVVWMLGLLGRRRWTIRFGLLDGLVLFLVLWHGGAAFVGAQHAHARPAVNMFWEWVGLGMVFLAFRRWIVGAREIRGIVAVMLALAVGVAGYGLFQCVYEFPRTRAAYYANPEKALRDAGLPFPPGSVERIAFEKRLESREPLATFALTNSLAGFLVPWLVVAAGLALLGSARSAGWRPVVGLVLATGVLGVCLLLTKSRSAYLAGLVGIGGLGTLWLGRQRAKAGLRVWRRAALVLGGLGLAVLGTVAGAFALGGLDIQVITEAKKSLGYRWEYWQATARIIQNHPVWGCGPGLFRYAYTRYKLPQASEEIADPHNFLLEIWATAGTPAALAMLGFLACWVFSVLRTRRLRTPDFPRQSGNRETQQGALPRQGDSPKSEDRHSEDRPIFPLVGGILGVFLGYFVGQSSTAPPSGHFLLIGGPLGLVTLWAFWPWVQKGALGFGFLASSSSRPTPSEASSPPTGTELPLPHPSSSPSQMPFAEPEEDFLLPRVLLLAGGVLLVNLLAAGGISFPGVAGSFWLLAALATGRFPPWGSPEAYSHHTPKTGPSLSRTTPQPTSGAEKAQTPSPPGPSGISGEAKETPGDQKKDVAKGRSRRNLEDAAWGNCFEGEYVLSWPMTVGGLFLTLALFFACHQTAFSPVLQCQGLIRQAFSGEERNPVRVETLLRKAAVADPLSAVPAQWLSALAFQQWAGRGELAEPDAAEWQRRFEEYADLALHLNPQDAGAWLIQGERFLEMGHRFVQEFSQGLSKETTRPSARRDRAETLRQARRAYQKAVGCLQEAAALYPNNAYYRARLAEAFGAIGYQVGMRREAEAALQLDEQMPHPEKKLSETWRDRVARMRKGLYNGKN